MTEEDATLQEAEEEIRKWLEIIAENQEIILKKDKTIIMLQNVIKVGLRGRFLTNQLYFSNLSLCLKTVVTEPDASDANKPKILTFE